jgi:hypothetical protein
MRYYAWLAFFAVEVLAILYGGLTHNADLIPVGFGLLVLTGFAYAIHFMMEND